MEYCKQTVSTDLFFAVSTTIAGDCTPYNDMPSTTGVKRRAQSQERPTGTDIVGPSPNTVKRLKKKAKQTAILSQQAVDAINSVANGEQPPDTSSCDPVLNMDKPDQPCNKTSNSINDVNDIAVIPIDADSDELDLQSQINDLKLIIEKQNRVINALNTRLNFVLSMYSIPDNQLALPDLKDLMPTINSNDDEWPKLPSTSGSGGSLPGAGTNERGSRSQAKLPATTPTVPTAQRQFSQAVLSAVYNDSRSKAAYSTSIVVKGLQEQPNCDDKSMVSELLQYELDLVPHIRSAKRLGLKSTGRIQPLLVSLSTVDEVSRVLSAAKKLRKSQIPEVRQHIYIDAYMTRAEAYAAFQTRCRRRQKRGAEQTVAAPVQVIETAPSTTSVSPPLSEQPNQVLPPSVYAGPASSASYPSVLCDPITSCPHVPVPQQPPVPPTSSGYIPSSQTDGTANWANAPVFVMSSVVPHDGRPEP